MQIEIDRALRRDWLFVGHVGGVRSPGDYFTTDLADEPLIVTRETLQKALKTRTYQCGPLAPDDFEGTIRDFISYMALRLAT